LAPARPSRTSWRISTQVTRQYSSSSNRSASKGKKQQAVGSGTGGRELGLVEALQFMKFFHLMPAQVRW